MGLIGRIVKSLIKDSLREVQTEIYKNMIKSSRQVLPPGIDCAPIEDDQGVVIIIESEGKSVSIGVYPDPQAESGEVRFYSRDDNGNQKAYSWHKKDGTLELNGNADFAVAFNDLKTGFDQLKSDFNTFVSVAYNLHTHVSVTSLGTPTPPVPTGSSTAASIDGSKVDTVKLP
jgi:hypothetical protein